MIVVDASVLTNALADDGHDGIAARGLLAREGSAAIPDLADVETVAVLRKRWIAKTITARRFAAAIEDLGDLPFQRYPALPFMSRAYELRSHVTAYDATYVALAEALACDLVTADRRLSRAHGLRCAVRLIGSSGL